MPPSLWLKARSPGTIPAFWSLGAGRQGVTWPLSAGQYCTVSKLWTHWKQVCYKCFSLLWPIGRSSSNGGCWVHPASSSLLRSVGFFSRIPMFLLTPAYPHDLKSVATFLKWMIVRLLSELLFDRICSDKLNDEIWWLKDEKTPKIQKKIEESVRRSSSWQRWEVNISPVVVHCGAHLMKSWIIHNLFHVVLPFTGSYVCCS